MAEKISKTARASMVAKTYQDKNFLTQRICAISGERIPLGKMMAVKVLGKGMVYYNSDNFNKDRGLG